MKTKPVTTTIWWIVAFAAITAGANAGEDAASGSLDSDAYKDFARSGVFDPELSNSKANNLASKGLFSGNRHLIRLTVEAMGAHAIARAAGKTVVERRFSAVPQLKEFLIAHWRARLTEEGGVIVPLEEQEAIAGFVKEALDNGDNPWVAMVAFIPDLSIIPSVLATHFPGDEDVYDLLWDFYPLLEPAPQAPGWILGLFNEGLFKTYEVDQLRIDSLGSDERLAFIEAAKGLAMSKPQRALEPLIAAARDNDDDPVLEMYLTRAIVAYGPEAISVLDESGLEHIAAKIRPLR
ncbi:MAG: hypothetical protein F4089_08285 [Gammaproteobacteria bacterium]|nr:hypothetical protein [Gammaproteobacteria bacterium]